MVTRLYYLPRLDGIRALAIGSVLISHFWYSFPGVEESQAGRIGVRLFFTLSGFLITRILIDLAERASPADAARQFYWRRFLRLSPPLILTILICLATGLANMGENWPWHVFYLTNVLVTVKPIVDPASHFWSLAVEEQFYLFWFLVVVCLPRRWLLPAIAVGIIGAPLFRLFTQVQFGVATPLTPAVMDCLALGALIGWASLKSAAVYNAFANWRAFTASGVCLLILLLWPNEILFASAVGLWSASFIALAALPEQRGLNFLNLVPLRDLGKISYGVYVYHKLMPPLFGYLGIGFENYALRGLAWSAAAIGFSALSWHLMEKPILSFKRLADKAVDDAPGNVPACAGDDANRVNVVG